MGGRFFRSWHAAVHHPIHSQSQSIRMVLACCGLPPPPTPDEWDEVWSGHRDLPNNVDCFEARYRWTIVGEMTAKGTGRGVPKARSTSRRDIRGGGACCCVLGARSERGGVVACKWKAGKSKCRSRLGKRWPAHGPAIRTRTWTRRSNTFDSASRSPSKK